MKKQELCGSALDTNLRDVTRRLMPSSWMVVIAVMANTLVVVDNQLQAADGAGNGGCGSYYRCEADCPTEDEVWEECWGAKSWECLITSAQCGWRLDDPYGCGERGPWGLPVPTFPSRVRCEYSEWSE